jgi:hypothetical protein
MHGTKVNAWSLVVAGALAVLCASCTTPETKPARAPDQPANSGFLSDYGLLQADPEDAAYRHYVAPGFDAARYRKFIIDTPEIIVNTGGKYQPLDPAPIADIQQYYQGVMAAALGTHYQVVTEPGPGVARLRVAVVGLVEVNPPLKPRDLIPVSALFKVARAAAGKNPQVLRVSIESEALDSETGTVLGETVDSRESTATVTRGDAPASAQVHQLIDFWVKRFVGKLDKANGFTG